MGVELEEVAAMLNSRNPDLEALRLRLEAMEEKLTRLEPVLQQKTPPPKTAAAAGPATLSPLPQENKPTVSQQVKQSVIRVLNQTSLCSNRPVFSTISLEFATFY